MKFKEEEGRDPTFKIWRGEDKFLKNTQALSLQFSLPSFKNTNTLSSYSSSSLLSTMISQMVV